jgi:hypothetical protein
VFVTSCRDFADVLKFTDDEVFTGAPLLEWKGQNVSYFGVPILRTKNIPAGYFGAVSEDHKMALCLITR